MVAVATVSACVSLRNGGSGSDCLRPPFAALAPFAPARALAVAGNYDFTLVADSGLRTGHTAGGIIFLTPNDTLHRYYVNGPQGWRRHGDRPLPTPSGYVRRFVNGDLPVG